jgi:hypothetical protein
VRRGDAHGSMASCSAARMGYDGYLDKGGWSIRGSPPMRWGVDRDSLCHAQGSEGREGISVRWSLYPVATFCNRSQGIRRDDPA